MDDRDIPVGTPTAETESHPPVRVRRTGAIFGYHPEDGLWKSDTMSGEYTEVAGVIADYGDVDVVAYHDNGLPVEREGLQDYAP